jgi:hypothetical protein
MVVAKYDLQGELVWQRSFGSSTVLTVQGTLVQEQLKGLVRDSRGDVLVSGTLTGSVTVAGTTYAPNLLSPGARSMGFLAKLAGGDGAVLWFRTFSGEQGINTCCEVAVDDRDTTYLTPQVYGANLHFSAGQSVIALGATDPSTKLGVILRYDTSGKALDARNLGAWQTSGTSSTTSELAHGAGQGADVDRHARRRAARAGALRLHRRAERVRRALSVLGEQRDGDGHVRVDRVAVTQLARLTRAPAAQPAVGATHAGVTRARRDGRR